MTPSAYYNEIDPFAAQWLRNLIAAGHIAPGEVDERSIEDVTPDDLRGFTQCHFFAGIGGWSYALRLAGWPDNRPIWTGSCPCQPFSSTGKGAGFGDDRHLWPAFGWLIKQCRPQRIAGEQVAGGRADPWFDLVQNDVERMGYAFGLTPFPAAGVG
ncbi:TPA: DNA cytosine methyltransferase, partial [Klebsiella pneumoniae]